MDIIINWLVNSSEDFQFLLYFLLLLIFLLLEYRFAFRKLERKIRWKTNFGLTLISILTLSAVPVTFITAAAYAEESGWGLFNSISINWIILGILTLLLRGLLSFSTHFLMHKISFFWRVHRVHHLDKELDVSTTVRFHPAEFLINTIIGIPFILVFGLPVWALLLYELFDVAITLFSHSNIALPGRIEKTLRYFIVTPDLHRVHHSSYQPETDSNFSAVFPIWDIIFGTFKTNTKEPQKNMEIGLKEVRDSRTECILWLLASPFKNIKNGGS